MKTENSKQIIIIRNNPELTERIKNLIGEEITSYKRIRNYYNPEDSEYKTVYFVVNWKYLITIYFDKSNGKLLDKITIQDYIKTMEKQKEFGKRVTYLAETAGVPWNIAELVAYIENINEALDVLKFLKDSKQNVTRELNIQLYSGHKNRLCAINQILGEEVFNKFNCKTNHHIMVLGCFLAR